MNTQQIKTKTIKNTKQMWNKYKQTKNIKKHKTKIKHITYTQTQIQANKNDIGEHKQNNNEIYKNTQWT